MLTDEFATWEASIRRMHSVMLSIVSDPKTAQLLAVMYRELYNALLTTGFSPAEAIMITSARPAPQVGATGV
ncbi:MAG: hypothetical protein V4529_08005 [Gemmatimonadota bacterium]